VPSNDVYCDVCTSLNLNKKKANTSNKSKKLRRPKVVERKIPPDVYCRICLMNDFALKRVRKGEWYHITCLMMHDLVYHRNNEIVMRPEKTVIPSAKDGTAVLHGPTCNICKKGDGLIVSCENKNCFSKFHLMCGYLAGF